MAKRQKLKNVVISDEELKPTTVGYLDSKQKGPILLFFIFAVLIGALYYMPEISEYVNKNILGIKTSNKDQDVIEDDISTDKIVEVTDDMALKVGDLEFRDFSFNSNSVSFKVTNVGKSDVDLSSYYYETYNESQKIIERVAISNETISSNKTLELDITTKNSSYQYISFSSIDINNLPDVELTNNTLSCTVSNEEEYTYNFSNGSLVRVIYKLVKEKSNYDDEKYNGLLSSYTEIAASTIVDGISNGLSNNEYSFIYTKTIDLQIVDKANVDNALYYSYQESANKIAFEMSTKGYKCN